MDGVALASVIFSGTIGIGGLWLTARSTARRLRFDQAENERRRQHERALSHDERIRDDRVRLYVRLLTEAERVSRDIRVRYQVGNREAPIKASDAVPDYDQLDELAASLLAFASDSVAGAWMRYTEALKAFRLDPAAIVAVIPDTANKAEILKMLEGAPPEANAPTVRERLQTLWMEIDRTHHLLIAAVRVETTQGA